MLAAHRLPGSLAEWAACGALVRLATVALGYGTALIASSVKLPVLAGLAAGRGPGRCRDPRRARVGPPGGRGVRQRPALAAGVRAARTAAARAGVPARSRSGCTWSATCPSRRPSGVRRSSVNCASRRRSRTSAPSSCFAASWRWSCPASGRGCACAFGAPIGSRCGSAACAGSSVGRLRASRGFSSSAPSRDSRRVARGRARHRSSSCQVWPCSSPRSTRSSRWRRRSTIRVAATACRWTMDGSSCVTFPSRC